MIPMDRFVHEQNLVLLRKQLEQMTDEGRRQQIARLIAEEEAKEPPHVDDAGPF